MVQQKKPINIRVGKNIQLAREEHHFTQEQLSERLGVTPNHMSAIERGVSGVSLELLEKLCEVLGVSSDSILFGQEGAGGAGRGLDPYLEDFVQRCSKIMENMEILDKRLEQALRSGQAELKK